MGRGERRDGRYDVASTTGNRAVPYRTVPYMLCICSNFGSHIKLIWFFFFFNLKFCYISSIYSTLLYSILYGIINIFYRPSFSCGSRGCWASRRVSEKERKKDKYNTFNNNHDNNLQILV